MTSWIFRFIDNCRSCKCGTQLTLQSYLTTNELRKAEKYWYMTAQLEHFKNEIDTIKSKSAFSKSSQLLSLRLMFDSSGILRVGGRQQNSQLSYSQQHPIILHSKHPLTCLIIHSEHLRLLHAGPTLLTASLCRRYHIIGCKRAVRSITRGCVTCHKLC